MEAVVIVSAIKGDGSADELEIEDPPDKDVEEEIVNNSLLLRNLAVPSQFVEEEQ